MTTILKQAKHILQKKLKQVEELKLYLLLLVQD